MRTPVSTSAGTERLVEPPVSGRSPGPDVLPLAGTAPLAAQLDVNSQLSPGFTRVTAVLFWLAVTCYVVARLWRLTTYGLFGDEVFTFWTADQDLGSLLASVSGDVVHPPLFYLALKGWIALGGSSILWLKCLPALFSFAAIPPLVLLCRELRMPAAAVNLTVGLMAFNVFLVSYAQELRMYSLLMTLTIVSFWLFVKLINLQEITTRVQAALAGVNLLLVFTHYYGWVIVALELLFLLIWKREKARRFAIGAAAVFLAFSPWAFAVSREARDKPARVTFVWNAPPGLSDFAGFYANLNGALSYRWKVFGTLLVMIVFATPIVIWGLNALRSTRARDKRQTGAAMTFTWFALFAFAPALISFCASHALSQSIWAPRYLIIAAPAYLMLVAAAVFKLPGRHLGVAIAVLVFSWAAVSGSTDLVNRDRIAWEPLVSQMLLAEPNASSGLRVNSIDPNLGNTIQFYLDRLSKDRCEVVYVDGLENLPAGHFWVAHIRYKHEAGPLPQQKLREAGYEVGDGFEAEAANQKGFLFPVWKR